jgi:hypothetical protein
MRGSEYEHDSAVTTSRRPAPPAPSSHAGAGTASAPRLSDAAIRAIARGVARALSLPPPDDQSTWILSAAAELAPSEEDRVIAALGGARCARRRQRP